MKQEILSETQYYTKLSNGRDGITVQDELGNKINLSSAYVENVTLHSADKFEKTEKVTKTKLAELFLSKARLPMTVKYHKKLQEKDVPTLAKELVGQSSTAISRAVKNFIRGEERVIRGRHYGGWTEDGTRIMFIDMDVERKSEKYDDRYRQVDPRTIEELIVDNVKYVLK